MRWAIVLLAAVATCGGCNRGTAAAPAPMIQSNYDKFTDTTRISTSKGTVRAAPDVSAWAMFELNGNRTKGEPIGNTVRLLIESDTARGSTLELITDGQRSQRPVIVGTAGESVVNFSADDFRALAGAKAVDCRLGGVQFTLPASALTAFRQVGAMAVPTNN